MEFDAASNEIECISSYAVDTFHLYQANLIGTPCSNAGNVWETPLKFAEKRKTV